jgi:uncharacterized membrane protein
LQYAGIVEVKRYNKLMDHILIFIILGLIFLFAGLALKFFPPKKINGIYGYRTGLSMKEQRYWDFSQKYSGNISALAGIAIILIGFILQFLNLHILLSVIISLILAITAATLIIVLTQMAIKKRFGLTKKDQTASLNSKRS